MKKIYEFLLWNNCSNNCTFCHQRAHERRIDDKILCPEEQIESLDKCQDFLEHNFEIGNHILLVGGEIFDIKNADVKLRLKNLLLYVMQSMMSAKIDLFYVNTNLLYVDVELLLWFLDLMEQNQLMERLKFTTSYDIKGRFTSFDRELLFYHNLKTLTDKYDKLHVVVNTVLTKEACIRIQEDKFGADYLLQYIKKQGKNNLTIKDWMDYFRVEVNTIPYIRLTSDIAPEMPTKKMVTSTLFHIDNIIDGYLERYANNIALTQEKCLYEYNKVQKEYIYCSSALSNCGHSINFKLSFSDSDECFPCAMLNLIKYKI